MHDLIGTRRHDVFLNQHLDAIGHRLKEPAWPDTIGPVTILDAPQDFSLKDRNQREERGEKAEQQDDVQESGCDLQQPIMSLRQLGERPLFQADENLVEKGAAHVR